MPPPAGSVTPPPGAAPPAALPPGRAAGVTTIDTGRRARRAEEARQAPTPEASPPRLNPRQRNRLAAGKSRRKRTQAVQQLEADERAEGGRRAALAALAEDLELEAARLRRLLTEHTDCRCATIRAYFDIRRRLGLEDGPGEVAVREDPPRHDAGG